MSTTRIIYDQNTQTGKMLAQAVNSMLVTLDKVKRVKAILDAASWGDDWAAVASEVGGNLTPEQAQALWAIFSNAAGRIDDVAVLELKRLDQG